MTSTAPEIDDVHGDDRRAQQLRTSLGSRVVLPGEPEYDTARVPWNIAVDQRPFAVVRPETAEEVVDAVRAAVTSGLRVAVQSTGHAAAALADTDLSDVVLVDLGRLRGVTVDPGTRTARVLGGTPWADVLDAAAPHGLTALHGSAGDVSVVGYTLSGGLSFYGREHGLAVNAVREVQLVTADGCLITASASENAELFWALRGGGGAFGAVVSLEIDLLPVADVVAGMLLWDVTHAAEVAHAWARWTQTAPESATTTIRILHVPPLPELPPFLSGRSLVVIDGALLEPDDVAAALLAPLRALQPEMDTFGRMPAAALVGVHMDPPDPTPSVSAHAVLDVLPPEAVDAFVASAVPAVFVSEIRHLGGALARESADGGAISAISGSYLVHPIAAAPVPEAVGPARAAVGASLAAVEPWRAESLVLTFHDGGRDRAGGFGASVDRLRALKQRHDPSDLFAAAHPV